MEKSGLVKHATNRKQKETGTKQTAADNKSASNRLAANDLYILLCNPPVIGIELICITYDTFSLKYHQCKYLYITFLKINPRNGFVFRLLM